MSFEVALFIAIAMLLGNAFFVGAEFGLISARRSNIEPLALKGSRSAKITLNAMENVSFMLAGAQLGITLCSLVLGAVGEPLIAHSLEGPLHTLGISDALLHPVSFLIALMIMVYLHVVIGEMVPKNVALAGPERTALLLTPPLAFIVKTIRPIVSGLNALANYFLKALGIKPKDEIPSTFTRDEVAGFVAESRREGLLSEDEEQLLTGILKFDQRTVKPLCLPLKSLVIASAQSTPRDLEKLAATTGYSRIPVNNKTGDLAGYIHLKDLLNIAPDNYERPLSAKKLRPLIAIRENTSLRQALTTMQQSGAHLAKVIDSAGSVTGIIALEDVLEELVGEIHDESQKSQRHIF